MTLIVSMQRPRYTVLVGDQRITSDGCPVADHSNKLGVLVTADGRFAVGYAGLAYSPQRHFVTQDWLVSSMLAAAKLERTYHGILQRLKNEATSTFASDQSIQRLAAVKRRLTIIVVGFTSHEGIVRGRLSLLSNYQDFTTRVDSPAAWSEFKLFQWMENNPGTLDVVSELACFW